MTYPSLSVFAAILSAVSFIGSGLAYFRWDRRQTNKALSSVFLWLAIAVNAAVTAIDSASHYPAHWILVDGLLLVDFVLLGLVFYLRRNTSRTG